MKTKVLHLILTLCISFLGYASSLAGEYTPDPKGGTISGKVVDAASQKPMEYVNIALYRTSDSLLVTGTITSEQGEFRLDKVPHGEYYVKVTFLGFEKFESSKFELSSKNPASNLGSILLKASASTLGEVSVVAEKSKVEYQIDKRVINVEQSVVSRGGSAVDVLENTPSIQVDPQKNVKLRGSSDFIVLIDGKPTALKGSDALKQINAASIKQIEVITNPSAKYDSEGQAGIINIIRKKDQLQGLSGNINLSVGTTDKYTSNALVNYRKGRINMFAGIDFADNIYRNNLTVNNISYLPSGNMVIQEEILQQYYNQNLSGKAGFDFDINEKNSLSFSGGFGKQGYDQRSDATYMNRLESNDIRNFYTSSNFIDIMGNVPNLNMDYIHRFGENHTLSFSSTFTAWDGRDENTLTEKITDENFQEISLRSKLHHIKDNYNYQYRFNADYKMPVKQSILEVGIQYRHEDRVDDLDYERLDVDSNVWIPLPQYTYDLDYLNDIYSGYATISGSKWGIGYMLGLRSEYFTRSISISNDTESFEFDKFMFYPSVHLSKDIKGKHQFQISYSRRINRPQPWLLNKQPSFIDPYNVFQGSPYLEPEFTDAFELNYRLVYKKLTVSTQTYFRNTTNSFNALRTLQDDGIMIHQLINTDNQQSYGIEAGVDLNFATWWQLSTGANLYHYTLETLINNENSERSANSWNSRLINTFSLKWGTRIQAVSYFQGSGIDVQGTSEGFYTVNLALNQPVMKGKLNIGFSAENIFDSIKFDYEVSSSNYKNQYYIQAEGPVFMLTASWSFNNFQHKQRGRQDDASFKGGGMF